MQYLFQCAVHFTYHHDRYHLPPRSFILQEKYFVKQAKQAAKNLTHYPSGTPDSLKLYSLFCQNQFLGLILLIIVSKFCLKVSVYIFITLNLTFQVLSSTSYYTVIPKPIHYVLLSISLMTRALHRNMLL